MGQLTNIYLFEFNSQDRLILIKCDLCLCRSIIEFDNNNTNSTIITKKHKKNRERTYTRFNCNIYFEFFKLLFSTSAFENFLFCHCFVCDSLKSIWVFYFLAFEFETRSLIRLVKNKIQQYLERENIFWNRARTLHAYNARSSNMNTKNIRFDSPTRPTWNFFFYNYILFFLSIFIGNWFWF